MYYAGVKIVSDIHENLTMGKNFFKGFHSLSEIHITTTGELTIDADCFSILGENLNTKKLRSIRLDTSQPLKTDLIRMIARSVAANFLISELVINGTSTQLNEVLMHNSYDAWLDSTFSRK
ncbi:MAG: hypothetical protein IH840_10355 [Candidatus Heimdallarchaeota archaeon]|nr:hypothetical protein [Candidatus Heimdallarchaeota archaeon]